MNFEHRGPLPGAQGPNANNRRPTSELWGQWEPDEEDTQPLQPQAAVSVPYPTTSSPAGEQQGEPSQQQAVNSQTSYREHVTGALPAYPSDAPLFRPAYMPYPPSQGQIYPPAPPAGGHPSPQQQGAGYPPPQGYAPYPMPGYPPQGGPSYQGVPAYPGYQGYAPAVPGAPGYAPYGMYPVYPGYNGYPPYYAWQALEPKRDGFHLAVSIISLVASVLTFLGGLGSVFILALILIGTSISSSSRMIHPDQYFSALLTFTAFAIAGIFGGGFSIYHSIRALLRKRSVNFALPWFWVFLILYLIVVGIGYALYANKQEVASPALTVFLIILAAIFPAFALTALGVRRLRFPEWTTTWRRFTLALTSGATLGIGLALILELGFLFLLVRGPDAANFQKCIDNPNQPGCGSFTTFDLIFLIVAVVGPIVEETVKPLAVAFYIGRMLSASEAFVLGMAAGIGFAMVETVGYIGSGYHDWLSVALERTGAGLLHGFGAAMVALGWYYLVHAKERRLLKAFGCWAYAVFQHFVWNATAVLSLLPGPVGSTLNSWNLNLGFVTLPFIEILNIIEAVLILIFFIYMTGRLRRGVPPPSSQVRQPQPAREPHVAARM